MKEDYINKIFLLYCYEYNQESNARMFDAMAQRKVDYPYNFSEHTAEQNEKFLLKWKESNKIYFYDFKFYKKFKNDKYGTPMIVERVKGKIDPNIDFTETDVFV